MQDRIQVFNQEFQLLIIMGGHGLLPGQFQGLTSITIDKNNRVFTSEIFPGRVQQFKYVTEAEFAAEKERREKEREAKKSGVKSDPKPADAAAVKESAPATAPK
jgi:hypothetical protein